MTVEKFENLIKGKTISGLNKSYYDGRIQYDIMCEGDFLISLGTKDGVLRVGCECEEGGLIFD